MKNFSITRVAIGVAIAIPIIWIVFSFIKFNGTCPTFNIWAGSSTHQCGFTEYLTSNPFLFPAYLWFVLLPLSVVIIVSFIFSKSSKNKNASVILDSTSADIAVSHTNYFFLFSNVAAVILGFYGFYLQAKGLWAWIMMLGAFGNFVFAVVEDRKPGHKVQTILALVISLVLFLIGFYYQFMSRAY